MRNWKGYAIICTRKFFQHTTLNFQVASFYCASFNCRLKEDIEHRVQLQYYGDNCHAKTIAALKTVINWHSLSFISACFPASTVRSHKMQDPNHEDQGMLPDDTEETLLSLQGRRDQHKFHHLS